MVWGVGGYESVRMMGSGGRDALLDMGVVFALLLGENLLEWGGGLGEGVEKVGPGPRVTADG